MGFPFLCVKFVSDSSLCLIGEFLFLLLVFDLCLTCVCGVSFFSYQDFSPLVSDLCLTGRFSFLVLVSDLGLTGGYSFFPCVRPMSDRWVLIFSLVSDLCLTDGFSCLFLVSDLRLTGGFSFRFLLIDLSLTGGFSFFSLCQTCV